MKTKLFLQTTLLLIVILIGYQPCLNAQQDSTKSPAKNIINTFWAQINGLKEMNPAQSRTSFEGKIVTAERKISETKTKDPSWNTTAMENAIAAQRNRLNGADQVKSEKEEKAKEDSKTIFVAQDMQDSLFNRIPYEVNYNGQDAATRNSQLRSEYRMRVARYAAMKIDARYTEKIKRDLQNSTAGALQQAHRNASFIRTCEDTACAGVFYDQLLGLQEYWSAAKTIFPEEPSFANTWQSVSDTIALFGGRNKLGEVTAKALENRGRNLHVPPKAQSNAQLEGEVKSEFQKQYASETIMMIRLLDSDWIVKRNELTGIILSRSQAAVVVSKNKDGYCVYHYVRIHQDYNGSSYQKNEITFADPRWIHCDNVK